MSRTLFENSKAALAFAGVTIFGAVIMIGSPDNEGVLDKAVDRFAEKREDSSETAAEIVETRSAPTTISDPDAGWGSSQPVRFPGSRPEEPLPEPIVEDSPPPRPSGNSQTLDMIPGPQPVIADSVGIPVPGPD